MGSLKFSFSWTYINSKENIWVDFWRTHKSKFFFFGHSGSFFGGNFSHGICSMYVPVALALKNAINANWLEFSMVSL